MTGKRTDVTPDAETTETTKTAETQTVERRQGRIDVTEAMARGEVLAEDTATPDDDTRDDDTPGGARDA